MEILSQNNPYVDSLEDLLIHENAGIEAQQIVNIFCLNPGNGFGLLMNLQSMREEITNTLLGFYQEHFYDYSNSSCIFDVGYDIISDMTQFIREFVRANSHSDFCR